MLKADSIESSLYLDLLKRCLTRMIFPDACMNRNLVPEDTYDPAIRQVGRDWPTEAETMVGIERLAHLESCVGEVLRNGIPGDLVETGVWRGGASILMRAVLKVYGDLERKVWLFDSFEGLPVADPDQYPADRNDRLSSLSAYLGVSLEQVRTNFARYGLLDDQVRFVKGWFKDTVPGAPVDKIAVLRLDGDMYESTIQVLEGLYSKVSPGGFVVVDDYVLGNCRAAVQDFRNKYGIVEGIQRIDWTGVFWQRNR